MNRKAIIIKRIESLLSKKIKGIYQNQLNHKLNNISYDLSDRTLIITLEGIVTSPEKLLKDNNHAYLAEQVREAIDSVIHPQIQSTIEEVLDVKVADFLSSSTLEHDLTGAIAIFDFESYKTLGKHKS